VFYLVQPIFPGRDRGSAARNAGLEGRFAHAA
jgi:hypothetical protein